MGNYKDSKIQTLARKGNGNFAYLDNFPEAEKVLMTEFTQTMFAVADNAYLNVRFNPNLVKEYRLIGFDDRLGAINDTSAVIEGGEIGSGNSMMIVFQITPTAVNTDAVQREVSPGNLADLALFYKIPMDTTQRVHRESLSFSFTDFNSIDRSFRFSASVIMFGSLLRQSPFSKKMSWANLMSLASESSNDGDPLQKEYVALIKQAKALYAKHRKRRRLIFF
jgi:Ca-activated chloride channel family protein